MVVPTGFRESKSCPAEIPYVMNHESNGSDSSPYGSLDAMPPANRTTGADADANVAAVPIGVVSAMRIAMRELKSDGHAGSAARPASATSPITATIILFI